MVDDDDDDDDGTVCLSHEYVCMCLFMLVARQQCMQVRTEGYIICTYVQGGSRGCPKQEQK